MRTPLDFASLKMQVSRTEQKKMHERRGKIGEMLTRLPKKQQKTLQISAEFARELAHLQDIKSDSAKNRQKKRIAKLILSEDYPLLLDGLFERTLAPTQQAKALSWHDRLLPKDVDTLDEDALKLYMRTYTAAEYNTLYQLILWVLYARFWTDEALLAESLADFDAYLKESAILSADALPRK